MTAESVPGASRDCVVALLIFRPEQFMKLRKRLGEARRVEEHHRARCARETRTGC